MDPWGIASKIIAQPRISPVDHGEKILCRLGPTPTMSNCIASHERGAYVHYCGSIGIVNQNSDVTVKGDNW